MDRELALRSQAVLCLTVSFLIGCGGSSAGGDGGSRPASGGVDSKADSWVGTARSVLSGVIDATELDAEITWIADAEQPVPGQTSYSARGKVSYRFGDCAVRPAEGSIESHSVARMVIDWGQSPPVYSASGASAWIATVDCGGTPGDGAVGGIWLGDPETVDQSARGVLTGGNTIAGSATFGDPGAVEITFQWSFRRQN